MIFRCAGFAAATLAAGAESPDSVVVSIPAVKKGLSNQRMRVIQDLASASSLGYSVTLPSALTSRKGCHYESDCYLDYQASLDFWRVFDREKTLAALSKAGVSVSASTSQGRRSVVAPLQWPLTHTQLVAQSGSLRHWVKTEQQQRDEAARPLAVSLSDPRYCCLLIVPDTTAAVIQLARINAALVSAKRTRDHAGMVLRALRSRLAIGSRTCAVHWRDDDDFVVSNHKLDRRAYTTEMVRALTSLENCGDALLVLGDVPTRRLRPLLASFNTSSFKRLYTKQSLLKINWTREYEGWDDILGMVDFELGTRVDSFVGSPFSSFSVLIAVSRGDTRSIPTDSPRNPSGMLTLMPEAIDVDDRLAHLFRIQFPYTWDKIYDDPCVEFRSMSEKYAKRLQDSPSCVFDGRDPPLTATSIILRLFLALIILSLICFVSVSHLVSPFRVHHLPRRSSSGILLAVTLRQPTAPPPFRVANRAPSKLPRPG